MASYLTGDNVLFSNDAFGQHFAVEELYNDKANQCLLMKEAMKYYANILNQFSPLVASQDHRHSRWLAQPCKGMLPAALNGL
jgi:flavorubredoxin